MEDLPDPIVPVGACVVSDERARARGEAAEWHIRLQEDPDDMALIARFQAWISADDMHRTAWTAMGRTVAALDRAAVSAPAAHLTATRLPVPPRHDRRRRGAAAVVRKYGRWAAVAVAASVAVLVAPAIHLRLTADHLSGAGEVRRVTLADGSHVVLGPQSAIAVQYSASARVVRLISGRAHFEVAHNPARPFRVDAESVRTTVLGTVFDVETTGPAAATVAVTSGRVRVEGKGGGQGFASVLTAGQSVRLSRGVAERGREAPALMSSWRTGDLPLRHQAIAQAIDQVRPWYGGKIILMNAQLGKLPVTGIYNLHDPETALALMVSPHGGEVVRVTPWLLVVR